MQLSDSSGIHAAAERPDVLGPSHDDLEVSSDGFGLGSDDVVVAERLVSMSVGWDIARDELGQPKESISLELVERDGVSIPDLRSFQIALIAEGWMLE